MDKESGALAPRGGLRSWQGKPVKKRFEVISGQKIAEGKWYLKQMRIESLDPADANDGRVRTRTYLEHQRTWFTNK